MKRRSPPAGAETTSPTIDSVDPAPALWETHRRRRNGVIGP
jgi:hypothetical protein